MQAIESVRRMIATGQLTREQSRSPDLDGLDPLTGLPGAAFWHLVLTTESSRGVRYGRIATVVLISVVQLDRVGEAAWTVATDLVLGRVARLLRSGTRASDYVARVGETRFAVLLTETGEIAAINMVERVRDRCERDLAKLASGVHVAFGWASPSGSGTLLRAAVSAEARLRREAARLVTADSTE